MSYVNTPHPDSSYPAGDPMMEAWLIQGVLLRRVCGWFADVVMLAALCGVLWTTVLVFGILTLGLGLHLLGLLALVPFVYHMGFLLSPMTATPGQALFGLAVRRDEDLGPPTGIQALLFTLGFYVTLAAGVIWLGFALLTVRHRALHDLVSGLVVVRRRALTGPPGSWNMDFASPWKAPGNAPGRPPYA